MKPALTYVASIIGFAIESVASTALAQATANGPYYATPSWDQQLPASTRFIVLSNWGNAAVLDRETGLVWEQSPSTTGTSWAGASFHCNRLSKGGRTGWRLPTIQDLASLIDPTIPDPGPALPAGHPFSNVSSEYFSATTVAIDTSLAWVVFFDFGAVSEEVKNSVGTLAWCVRGGSGVDPQ